MGQRPWLSHGADFIGAPCAPTLGPAVVSQICTQRTLGGPLVTPGLLSPRPVQGGPPGSPASLPWPMTHACLEQAPAT